MFLFKKNWIISLIALAILFCLISFQYGCSVLSREKPVEENIVFDSAEKPEITQETIEPQAKDTGQKELEAAIEDQFIVLFQKNSDGLHFEKGNPVYFSASGNGRDYNFSWNIAGDKALYGDKVSYIFDKTGEYIITLKIESDAYSEQKNKKIKIIELDRPVNIIKEYNCNVSVEYILENKGNVKIKDITAFIDTPQTDKPFQQVVGINSNNNDFEKIFDNNFNLVSRFELGNLNPGEKKSVTLTSEVIINEFDFDKNLEIPSEEMQPWQQITQSDIELYTVSEPFIQADDISIRNIASNLSAGESEPIIIAEKIYDFVIENLDYDYEKLAAGNYDYITAKEILSAGKGVCTDYSILFATLCRAAGIPAKIITGIPVFAILQEDSGQLQYGHAWVEIKLPGYGWIPVDITHERRFMANNYNLNLKTHEGLSSIANTGTGSDGAEINIGVTYFWDGDIRPELYKKAVYTVRGLSTKNINILLEREFIDTLYNLLNDYNLAINHANLSHGSSWVFNNPGNIAIEESLLERFKELALIYEKQPYPPGLAYARSNILNILNEINFFKSMQINSMRNNDFEQYMENYNNFAESLQKLFDTYNAIVNDYNKKYG